MKNLIFMEKCGEIMLAWLRRKSVEMFGIWQEKGIDEDKEIWWGRELAINSFYQSFLFGADEGPFSYCDV